VQPDLAATTARWKPSTESFERISKGEKAASTNGLDSAFAFCISDSDGRVRRRPAAA